MAWPLCGPRTSVTMSAERPRVAATAHGQCARQGAALDGSDLRDVLAAAGVDQPGCEPVAPLVSVHARDGYVVVFALAELIARSATSVSTWSPGGRRRFGAHQGPWQLVVPTDRRPARWSRQVVRIVIADGP
jgi:hypothetical protein